jgi:hypothetical protein
MDTLTNGAKTLSGPVSVFFLIRPYRHVTQFRVFNFEGIQWPITFRKRIQKKGIFPQKPRHFGVKGAKNSINASKVKKQKQNSLNVKNLACVIILTG